MRRSGRPVEQPAARSARVVAAISPGVQRPTRMTPPISPASILARNDGFGRPARALTTIAPGVGAGAAAALGADESRSSSALQPQTRRRVEEVNPPGIDCE